VPPWWIVGCEDRSPGCICVRCCPTKLGPAEYYRDQWERQRSFEPIGFAPYEDSKEKAKGQPDWKRPTPTPKWKLVTRAKLKAEHACLFWSSDNLSAYEIWSELSYSTAFCAKGRSPIALPFLMAAHDFYQPKKGTIKPDGSPEKRTGRGPWSASIIGEGDCDHRGTTPCIVKWTYLGDSHKRRVAKAGEELVLRKTRKRFGGASSCQSFICIKPDSPSVLLFWARQIIAWHYLHYWEPQLSLAA
jgi:hypothetical protein